MTRKLTLDEEDKVDRMKNKDLLVLMYLEHDEELILNVRFHYHDHEQSKIKKNISIRLFT